MSILKGNIYYYNYPENYHQALACYTDALKSILKDARENQKCNQCSIMRILIYYEMMSVFYHLVKDNRLNYLNSNETEKYIQKVNEIIAEHTTKTNLKISWDISASKRLITLILIICETIFEEYKMVIERISDSTKELNHGECLLKYNIEFEASRNKLSETQLAIARFIVISLKLSEMLPLSIIEKLKFITKVLDLPVFDNKRPEIKKSHFLTNGIFRQMLAEMVTPCQYVRMMYSILESEKYKYWFFRVRKKTYCFLYQFNFWFNSINLWPISLIRIKYYSLLKILNWQIEMLKIVSNRTNERLTELKKNPFWQYLIMFHSSEIIKNTLTICTQLIDRLDSMCSKDLQLLKKQELIHTKNSVKNIINEQINNRLMGDYDFNEHKGLKTWRSARLKEMIGDFKLIYSELDDKETINSKNVAIENFLDAKMKYVKINSYSYAERVDNKIDTLYKELERKRRVP